ncbi:spermine oxidase [Leptinotarsa decemlineata]|uniref:spermine oxidase n=1 Tax=Leptinotarsa decemlineata TaxID=7539 RepID=UPI003D30C3F0
MAMQRFGLIFILLTTKLVRGEPSVIIIGAGAAGIAAGTKLLKNNFTNFKILEAEPRIGGRIRSVKLENAFVDLGAEWCDGQEGNLVYDRVKDLNLLEPTRIPTDIYLSTKTKLDDKFANELFAIFNQLQDPAGDIPDDRNETLGSYFEKNYPRIITQKYATNPNKIDIAKDAMDLVRSHVLWIRGGFSWFDPALITDHKNAGGDHTLNWKGRGFKTFLDILMEKYPDSDQHSPIDEKILLSKEVTNISWRNGANITCSDNSSYYADHVIFTPSVGVLKQKKDTLFSPELPSDKQRAIENIGFAAIIRVVMYFSEDWWRDSPGFFFVWTEQHKKHLSEEFPEGPNKVGQSWLTSLFKIYRQDSNPNVLIALFVGDFVPDIEVLPENLLMKGVYFVMERFLSQDYNVTKPDKIIRTNWYTNPHFKGSYSFQTIRARRENGQISAEEKLAEPLRNFEGKPLIQFAGEATNVLHYTTVQGAVETGYREADILLNLYQ